MWAESTPPTPDGQQSLPSAVQNYLPLPAHLAVNVENKERTSCRSSQIKLLTRFALVHVHLTELVQNIFLAFDDFRNDFE
jgi:hypothetical protein